MLTIFGCGFKSCQSTGGNLTKRLSGSDDRKGVVTDANANYFRVREGGDILVGSTLKTIILLHDKLVCYL